MQAPIDMNSQRILNLPQALNPTDPVRLQEVGNAPAYAAATLADRLLADADVVTTHADVVLTHADVVTTHADVVSANASAAAAAATLASSLKIANNLSDLGSVATAKTNLGLDQVNNTSDANKPLSTAVVTALALKAPLASPTFTGTPAAPTATVGTNTTQLATTAFVLANAAAAGVTSFAARTGAVVAQADDYAALGGLELFNLGFTVSASAGALTVNLTDATGATPSATSPVVIPFRNVTLATGTTSVLKVTAANSVVVPSTSTLGTTSAVACRLWIIGWNDGGTFRLGVFNASNASNIFPLVEYGLGSSLQVVAAGNTAGQHYTAGAAVTSKAFRILGYVDWSSSGVATAGTWTTTNLNSIQVFGPGVRKPGDRVQLLYAVATSTGSTTSTTYVPITSGITLAVTPTNAANPLRVEASGGANLSASAVAELQLSRGTTAATNLFGSSGFNNTTGGFGVSVHMFGLDLPNTVSATTYAVQGKTTAGTLSFPLAAGSRTVSMTIEELMG